MGRIIAEKVRGMNWKAKISLILIFTLVFSAFMYQGLYKPQAVQAAVGNSNAWVNVYSAAPNTTSGSFTSSTFTVGNDANRLLLGAVCMEGGGNFTWTTMQMRLDNASGAVFTTVASSAAAASGREQCYMGYLKASQVTAGTHSLYVSWAVSSAQAVSGIHAKAATFSGVDQNTPISGSAGNYSGNAAPTFGTAVDYTVGGLTTYVAANGGSPATLTNAAGFTTVAGATDTTSAHSSFASMITTIPHSTAGTYAAATSVTFGGTTSNRSAIVVASLRAVVTADTTKPVVTGFDATTPGSDINVPITLFTATDDVGVTGYMITTNSTPPSAGAGGWSGTAPTTFNVGSSGTYTLYPWAKDAAGNVSLVYGSPRTVIVDQVPPDYTWNTPAAGAYFKDGAAINVDVTITETGTGVTDGANCLPRIDATTAGYSGSVTYSSGTGKCTGTLTLNNPSGLAEGPHNLTLQVADNGGNSQQSAARVINIDNTPPNLPSNACPGANCTTYTPADEATGISLNVSLQSATATDGGSGSVQYWFEVWDTETYSANSGWTAGTSFAPPALQNGTTYFWKVKAKDAAGNETDWTTPRSFNTVAQCFRNEPSLTFIGSTTKTVTANGGTADYTLRVINNDIGGCPNTAFTLSTTEVSDVDDNFVDIATLNASTPPFVTNSLAPGGYQDITLGVTARSGRTAGRAKTKVTSAADAYHPVVNSFNTTTDLNVATCTASAPQIAIGPDAGNVAVGGTLDYSISVKNKDYGAACASVNFTVAIVSENPETPNANFNQSKLSFPGQPLQQAVVVPLLPGQTGTVTLTVSAPGTATVTTVGVATIGVTAPDHATPANVNATTTVGNVLLHNSINIYSTKWSSVGGWGVPGGKYGEFICNTCHVQTAATTNIKKVVEYVTAPDDSKGALPGEGRPIVFTRVTGNPGDSGVMGDDSDNPRSSSNRVCEICHTYDGSGQNGSRVHAYNQPSYTVDSDGATPTSSNHKNYNAKDCIACHMHKIGFRAPTCDTCHGNPPGVLANSPFTTGSATAGAHAKHATTLGYACIQCHNGYSMPQESAVKPDSGNISMGFSNFGSTTGAYSGHANVSYSLNGGAHYLGDNNKTCSTVYCHGSTIGGSSAVWDSTVSCGACHKATAGDPPTLGSHARHAGNGAGQLNIACSDCHGANGAGGNGHVSGAIEWAMNTASARIGANAKYWGSASGTVPNRAPSGTYRTCSTTYCHGASEAPTWGGGAISCSGCHGANNNGDLSVSSSIGHALHYNTSTLPTTLGQGDDFTSGYAYGCASCHPTNQHASGPATANGDANMGGTRMTGGQYAAGGVSFTDARGYKFTRGACANNSCHTDGNGGAAKVVASWNTVKTTPNCGVCHNKAGDGSPSWTAAHTKHVNTYSANANMTCNACHSGTAAGNTALQATVQARTQHPDGTKNLAFNAWSSGAGAAWSTTNKTCSNTYCHSAGTSANAATHGALTWTTVQTCTACHGGATTWTTTTGTGAHAVHVVSRGFTCNVCHNATSSNNTTVTGFAEHVDKNATITINSSYSTIGSTYNAQAAGWNTIYRKTAGTVTGTCNAITCHGGVSPNWGTINTGSAQCVKCHGVRGTTVAQYGAQPKTAAPGWATVGVNTSGTVGTITNMVSNNGKVGAHNSHLGNLKGYSTELACSSCHNVTALNDAGHMNGSTTFVWSSLARNAGNNNPKWTTLALSTSYSGGLCQNVYCHGGTAPASVRGTGWTSILWTNSAYLTTIASAKGTESCNRCHASPPTASTLYDHSVTAMPAGLATNCAPCHNHEGSGATHIDGTLYGAGACNACHWYDVGEAGAWTTVTKAAGGSYDNQSGTLWLSTNAWGAHVKHITHLKARYSVSLNHNTDTYGNSNFNQVCGFCHNNNTGAHMTVSTRQITWNTTTHQFGATALNWHTVTRSCSNLDCHYKPTPVW